MLLELGAGLMALASLIDGARSEVRLASPALASETVLQAVERASARGVPVKVVLGATPQYSLDARGGLAGPNRPFDKGPQGAELSRLDAAGAQTYIPPRFNEIGPEGLQRGVQAHMAYGVVDGERAIVCMAALARAQLKGLCVLPDTVQARAIAQLHAIDHGPAKPTLAAHPGLQTLAAADVVATPDMQKVFVGLLDRPWAHMFVGLLNDGEVIDALARSPHRPVVWLAAQAAHSRAAVAKLRANGFTVEHSPVAFDGTLLVSKSMAFLGSQRLDDQHLRRSRDLGVLVGGPLAVQALALARRWRAATAAGAPAHEEVAPP